MAKKKELSLKQRTMKLTGWTSEQYNKEYDKLRNRTRAYEKATGSTRKRDVAQVLFYTKKAEKTGSRLSTERKAILSTPSISSGKELSQRTLSRIQNAELSRFSGLAENNTAFAYIIDDDRLSVEQKLSALRKLGDKLNVDRQEARESNRQLIQGGGSVHDFYVAGSDEDMTDELDALYAEMGMTVYEDDFDE